MVVQVASRHGAPVIDLRLSQMEPTDLRGIPFRLENRVEWAVPAMLPDEARHGPFGILFLDEINAAPPTVSAAAYQLILDRRLGDYLVPSGWAIFAAGNRQGDRGVTYSMPAPLANRFSHFEVEVNIDDWVAWAHTFGIDERIIGFLRFRPERLFEFDAAHNPTAFPSPRSWEFTHRALQKFGERPSLLGPAVEACIGKAAAAELAAFIRNLDKLPDIDAVLRGEEVPVPQEVDLQYAVASALVARTRRLGEKAQQAHGYILEYATRFPTREVGVMLVADLYRSVGTALFSAPQFSRWARSVGDLVLYE
jgi:hypothetical protein